MLVCACASLTAQSIDHISHDTSLDFTLRDGKCGRGSILNSDASAVTIKKYDAVQVIPRNSILQIAQGDALLFSARSSWQDVRGVYVVHGESLRLELKNGEWVKGKPTYTAADSIRIKHGLTSTEYEKADVAKVDYVRVIPPTDSFSYLRQESPFLVFFTREAYSRAIGLEGKVVVHLYDASKPEDNTKLSCQPH